MLRLCFHLRQLNFTVFDKIRENDCYFSNIYAIIILSGVSAQILLQGTTAQ